MRNKKVRFYVNGVRQRDIWLHKTKWEVFKMKVKFIFKRIILVSMFAGSIYGAILLGANLFPVTTYAKEEVRIEVDKTAEVMERVAQCESGGRQYDKNGRVIINKNTNGSVDYGMYQLNDRVWGAKATELGFDIMTEKGNRDMAYWLFRNKGTAIWTHSHACWYRG